MLIVLGDQVSVSFDLCHELYPFELVILSRRNGHVILSILQAAQGRRRLLSARRRAQPAMGSYQWLRRLLPVRPARDAPVADRDREPLATQPS